MNDDPHEIARLQEIADLDVFADDLRAEVDELSEKAARHLKLPNCAISIVLDEAQFFLSMHGPQTAMVEDSQGTPREWSFCQYVVQDNAPFIVSDAPKNERVKNSPLVKIEGRRCYVGVPLVTSKGFAIGSFCAYGTETREFPPAEIEYLKKMAAETVRRIEARVGRELLFRASQRIGT